MQERSSIYNLHEGGSIHKEISGTPIFVSLYTYYLLNLFMYVTDVILVIGIKT